MDVQCCCACLCSKYVVHESSRQEEATSNERNCSSPILFVLILLLRPRLESRTRIHLCQRLLQGIHYARSNEMNATPKAAARMDWSDDEDKDDSPARPYKYQEVVRCRHDRQQLPGHCCPECDKFAESLCQAEGGHVFDKKEFLGMSRHRARHTPENTPPGFWELSFADEVEARKRNKDEESP